MKRTISLLAASLYAAMLSLGAQAAPDATADASAPTEHMHKQMKPHSHMEEKLGASVKTSADKPVAEDTATKKVNPAKDKTRHFHPRDGGK